MLQEYGGHKNTDFKIDSRLTYNDAYVVSGSENGSILMWDLVSVRSLAPCRCRAPIACR